MSRQSKDQPSRGRAALRFEHQVAIVTGAAQGLGAAFARALAAEGARVVIADIRNSDALVDDIHASGGQAMAVHVDVSDPDSVREMVAQVTAAWAGIQILVNNAALVADLDMQPILSLDSASWRRVMAVNAGGTFECIKAAGAVMTKAGRGKIVNVASSTFFKGAERMGHYAASKGAVIGLTRSVARELGEYGITVNCIAPGLTITPQLQGVDGFSGPRLDAAIASRALKRGQSPQDLLGAMLFFCSAESDFITGQTLVVDGGGVMQ